MDNKILLNMKVWLEKHIDTMFLCFGIVVSVSVLLIQFLSLKNNLIFSDEGWYLVLLRDIPHFGSSRFHLLFNNVFQNNIYLIRVFCWSLLLLGAIVLAQGITSMITQSVPRKSWSVFLWAFVSVMLGQVYIHSCPSLNYITLNIVAAEISVGCLLLGLSQGKWIYYLLSGVIISTLIPIMITNAVVIPLMCMAIFLLSSSRWKDCVVFTLGISLFLLLYFTCIENPSVFFEFIQTEGSNVLARGGGQYGIMFLAKWLINAVIFLFKQLILAVAIYAVYYFIKQHKFTYEILNNWKMWIAILLIISMLFLAHNFLYIKPIGNAIHEPFYQKLLGFKYIYWILCFWLILDCFVQNKVLNYKNIILGLLFFLMPICLSFGTNVTFYVRGTTYLMFITPIIIALSAQNTTSVKLIVFGVFLWFYASFITNIITKTNWHGETHFGNKIPVSTIGIDQHLQLSQYDIDKLELCRKYIPKGEAVICSMENWGVISLLDYKPVTYEFDAMRLDSLTFSKLIYDKINEDGYCWAISERYSTYFNYRIKQLESDNISIDSIVAGDNRYYLIKRNNPIQ